MVAPPGTVRTALGDGTPVTVRAVTPEDADALIAGFERLSRQSRVFRFLHVVQRLSAGDIAMFTTPDHSTHIALGVVVHDVDGDAPAGIAHLFRTPAATDRAELSVTVIDAYQRRGLGTLLLGRLMAEASRLGIVTLDALVHPANRGMAHLLRSVGAVERDGFGERHFVLTVPHRAPDPGSSRTGDAVAAAMALTATPPPS